MKKMMNAIAVMLKPNFWLCSLSVVLNEISVKRCVLWNGRKMIVFCFFFLSFFSIYFFCCDSDCCGFDFGSGSDYDCGFVIADLVRQTDFVNGYKSDFGCVILI